MLNALGRFECARRIFQAPTTIDTVDLSSGHLHGDSHSNYFAFICYGLHLRDDKIAMMHADPCIPEPIFPIIDLENSSITQIFDTVTITVLSGVFQWQQTGPFANATALVLLQMLADTQHPIDFGHALWNTILSPETISAMKAGTSA